MHVAGLVRRFATALEDGDTDTITQLLTEDVVFDMPPYRQCARGREDVAASWLVPVRRPTGLRTVIGRVNGQPAVAVYRSPDPRASAVPVALDVLALDVRGVTRITAFRAPQAFAALGLPTALAPQPTDKDRHEQPSSDISVSIDGDPTAATQTPEAPQGPTRRGQAGRFCTPPRARP